MNRNDLWDLGTMADAIEVSESTIPYITFTADEVQTFSYYNYSEQKSNNGNQYLEYSVGGGQWNNFNNVESVTFGGSGKDLRLRAIGGQGNYYPTAYNAMFKFGNGTVEVNCGGDIRTLIDYENYYCANTSKAIFSWFFSNMTNLKSAPNLPNMELANNCYKQMLFGCTGLTTAPELPATTLASNCYNGMFSGCTGLTQAPELNATTLADYCYSGMFNGCTGLTQAPELNATTLADYCYNAMFSGCKGLTTAPELNATTLADYCYSGMFFGCTGLTQAPELNATTLADYCYYDMFSGCKGLTTAPKLPATILVDNCYSRMFYSCSKLSNVTMLAIFCSASNCLTGWLYNAGTSATNRTLKLASKDVYDGIISNLPTLWRQGQATITYNQSE